MASDPNWSYFDRPLSDVERNLEAMNGRADAAITQVNQIISALENLEFPATETPPTTELPPIADFKPSDVKPAIGNVSSIGSLAVYAADPYDDLAASLGISLSDFDVDIPTFVLPDPPVFPADPAPMDESGKPVRPDFDTNIAIPDAPVFSFPEMDTLAQIDIPDFQFPDLPLFGGVLPTFDEARPSTTLIWSEPVYASEDLSDLTSRIRAMLAGGTGLPAFVQQALFDAARSREAQTGLEAEQGAFDSFAGKGFSMPPGMLAAAVAKAREKSRDAQNQLERDLLTKAAQWEIENIRVAVERGLGLETMLVNQFNNMAQRQFEAAKFSIEQEITVFNSMVTLYNAKASVYRVQADVFKILIDAQLAKLEVFKAQIQGAVAKGQLNEQLVKVYQAKLQGVTALVDVYKSRMQGAQVQSDVVKNIISAYEEDVKAWGQKITAEKERFQAYYELVRAKAEVSRSVEWQARAFEATVNGMVAKSTNKVRYIEAKSAIIRAAVDKWRANIENANVKTNASLDAIRAKAAAYDEDVRRYTAEIQGVNESRRTDLMISEARLRNNLAYFETLMKEYDAAQQRLLDQLKIKEAALDAAARTTAQLAAGAMSAIHVQAAAHGQASVSASNIYQVSHNFQDA
jgi:hypothetical protein